MSTSTVQTAPTDAKTSLSTQVTASRPARDWFGYILTALIGVIVTVAATWYQLYASDKQSTAAEIERARTVRQNVISIVEEQALSGKKLEAVRITRLIDQRRREQNVSIPVLTADVVEQAEFNIASSTYLDVERKEQIKPIFDSFHSDLAARSFKVFSPGTPNMELLNQLAKQIQEGKTAEALANVQRIQELHSEELAQLVKRTRPSILDAFIAFFTKPLNLALFILVYAVALMGLITIKRRRRPYYMRPN